MIIFCAFVALVLWVACLALDVSRGAAASSIIIDVCMTLAMTYLVNHLVSEKAREGIGGA